MPQTVPVAGSAQVTAALSCHDVALPRAHSRFSKKWVAHGLSLYRPIGV